MWMTATERAWLGAAVVIAAVSTLHAQQQGGDQPSFRFRSGVELINVTATVTDASGRFVPGLRQDDFQLYDDGRPQTITHFSAERAPVSLGIVLDTSDSMDGEKMQSARAALDRFFYDLLDPQDEVFLYRFDDDPELLQDWTTDRRLLSRALDRINPNGATAMYDAVAEAMPLVERGRHRKKALLIISDGNDTSSTTRPADVRELIRQSEALVYAIGIDAVVEERGRPTATPPPRPIPIPRPFPPRRPGRPGVLPQIQWPPPIGGWSRPGNDDRVNVDALRALTDDSGGRTELVRRVRDIDPATSSVARELSQQYYLGYPASGERDGRWHAIEVEVKKGPYRVRARRGYIAS
jgi:Ca-activated chloride channel family protein